MAAHTHVPVEVLLCCIKHQNNVIKERDNIIATLLEQQRKQRDHRIGMLLHQLNTCYVDVIEHGVLQEIVEMCTHDIDAFMHLVRPQHVGALRCFVLDTFQHHEPLSVVWDFAKLLESRL